jgi:arginase
VCAASLAGKALAAVVGKNLPVVADIDGFGPRFLPAKTANIGCRETDGHLEEVRAVLRLVVSARDSIEIGIERVAENAREVIGPRPYWLHIDIVVFDLELDLTGRYTELLADIIAEGRADFGVNGTPHRRQRG